MHRSVTISGFCVSCSLLHDCIFPSSSPLHSQLVRDIILHLSRREYIFSRTTRARAPITLISLGAIYLLKVGNLFGGELIILFAPRSAMKQAT